MNTANTNDTDGSYNAIDIDIVNDNDNGILSVDAYVPENVGCCAAMGRTKLYSKRIASFSHRWRSFRKDRHFRRHKLIPRSRLQLQGEEDDRTLSSSESGNSNSYTDSGKNRDRDRDRVESRFSRFWKRIRFNKHAPDGPIDTLATNATCNKHVRGQFEMWKVTSIEGPQWIRITSFVLAFLLLMVCATGMAVLATFDSQSLEDFTIVNWVACFLLGVSLLLIVLLESRSSLITRNGVPRDFHHANGIIPMDAYREYKDPHNKDRTAKLREGVAQTIGFFRYTYGRGTLSVFAGLMIFVTIPERFMVHAYHPLSLWAIALMIVGAFAVLAGAHAAFRWTLLETSIAADDDHLRGKYYLSASSESNNKNTKQSKTKMGSLNFYGFSILVTSLGLYLDEDTLLPTIFAQEVQPKDPNAMTFEEFRIWWRRHDAVPCDYNRRDSNPEYEEASC